MSFRSSNIYHIFHKKSIDKGVLIGGIMKYIIMCGGQYDFWKQPKQLTEICGEPIIARTIRLLREAGVENIAISSNNDIFEQFGVPVLKHNNKYVAMAAGRPNEYWVDAFYPTDEPVCYIFGDVVFSPEAIRTIVETGTKWIQFFASAPPFAPEYPKPWAEPFALKVVDTDYLKDSIEIVKHLYARGAFNRKPIMWELWNVITDHDLNTIDYSSYVAINDYTCDIDSPADAMEMEELIMT